MDDERRLFTVRDFDELLGTCFPGLLAEVRAERYDEGEFDDEGLRIEDRYDNYSVSGEALIHVFPRFLDRMAVAPDPDQLVRFVAFLQAWEDREPGAVLDNAMPMYLRGYVVDNPQLWQYFPENLREGYYE
jgi:hypothetical protein